jgi:hypothetical protein
MSKTLSMTKKTEEFKEIAHCGGHFKINVKTDEHGNRGIQFGWSHSRPTPSAIIAFYVLPQRHPCWYHSIGWYWHSMEPRSNKRLSYNFHCVRQP